MPATFRNRYVATVLDWIDGATALLEIALIRGLRQRCEVRVYGVAAPEGHDAGMHARTYAGVVAPERACVAMLIHEDIEGKPLVAELWTDSGLSVGSALLAAGHAVPTGGGPRPFVNDPLPGA